MKPKKIILIVIDTLRADHLGCHGYKRNTSPNIDKLAKEGIQFRYGFSPAPHTIPAHGSIFTSKYPSNHSIGFNQTINVETGKLNTDLDITLAETLNSIGYKTAAFLSGIVLRKDTNFNVGFEIYDDEIGSDPYGRRDGSKTNQRMFKWLENNYQQDFFLFVHYFDVHGPYLTSAPYNSMFINDEHYGYLKDLNADSGPYPTQGEIPIYQILNASMDEKGDLLDYEKDARYYIAQYDAGIRYCDDVIKRLLEKLKGLGIYDNTLIIITSDHGESLGENNVFFYHGLTTTLDQIFVPFIIKPHEAWNIKSRIIDTQVSSIDIMPTILSLCNYDYKSLGLEGYSLKQLIEKEDITSFNERILISENEYLHTVIHPDRVMEIRKKDPPTSTYYPSIPHLVDSLDGEKFYCDTGIEYELMLPFDEYQRYKVVADIINKFRLHDKKTFKILDVGAGVRETLKKFLPDDDIYNFDKEYPSEYLQRTNFLSGDITEINFKEEYDLVISVDTYEHVSPTLREKFINKLVHLSKIATIVAAPFDTIGVKENEIVANEVYRISHGIDHMWLKEHIQNGLPSLNSTLQLIKKLNSNYAVVPNGYLPRWFDMISVYLLTEGMPEFSKIMNELYEFYNKFFYCYDNKNQAYRQVIIINKSDKNIEFSELIAKKSESSDDFNIKYEILRSFLKKIKELYNISRKRDIEEKNRQISELSNVLQSKNSQIRDLEATIQEKLGQIDSMNLTILEKENQISELGNTIQNKDRQIESMNTNILEKENQISELGNTIQNKDRQIESMNANILEKENQISGLGNVLQNKDEQIISMEAEIQSIHQSVTWEMVTKYRRIVERLLPSGTRRRYSYHLFLRGVKMIVNEGWKIFWWKIKRYIRQRNPLPKRKIKIEKVDLPKRDYTEINETIDTKISVVIPTKNAGDDFEYTLNKIKNQKGIKEIEIVVVDSGSIDETVKIAKKYRSTIYQIKAEEFDHGKTRNFGAEKATGEFILFTTQDAIFSSQYFVYKMVKVLQGNHKIAAVTSRQIPRSDADLFACFSLWNHYKLLDFCEDRVSVPNQKLDDLPPMEKRRLAGLEDVCSLIRKDIFSDLKFEKKQYAEDLELGLRILKNEYKIAFLYSVGVIHSHNRSSLYFLKRSYVDNKMLPKILSYEPMYFISTNCDIDDVYSYIITLYRVLNVSIESLKSLSFDENVENIILKLKSLVQKNLKKDSSELEKFKRGCDDLDDLFEEIQKIAGTVDLKSNDSVVQLYFTLLDDFKMYMEVYKSLKDKKTEFLDSLYKLFAIAAGSTFANYYLFKSKNKESDEELLAIDHILSEGI